MSLFSGYIFLFIGIVAGVSANSVMKYNQIPNIYGMIGIILIIIGVILLNTLGKTT